MFLLTFVSVLNSDTEIEGVAALLALEDKVLYRALCSQSFLDFVKYIRPNYQVNWHHQLIADKLEAFERGDIKKLMICVPPQHGKSELSTRTFPAYLLGRNPNRKIAVLSYSDTKAQEFNRDIQRVIDSEDYCDVFPDTRLNSTNVSTDAKRGVLRNAHIFEIVGHGGFVKTVGRGGPLTGTPVDIAIIDDLYKDREEAKSRAINESIWSWWTDVVKTRFHNGSQVLAVNTRWDSQDWNARALAKEEGWTLITIPAIKEHNMNPEDPREIGQVLWEEKHSLERILEVKRQNPFTFNSLYQQDPKPSTEALVYPDWQVIDHWPANPQHEYYGGDYGFSNDPTAVIEIAEDGNNLFLREVIYETGLTNRETARRIRLYQNGKLTDKQGYFDSAEQKSNKEMRDDHKLKIADAVKGPGSVNAGINKLKEMRVYIHSSSKNLINERNNYQWIMIGGVATNEPHDSFNHGMDAVRYAVYTRKSKPAFKGSTNIL